MHKWRRKLTKQYGATWGLTTKEEPHATLAPQQHLMSHAHTCPHIWRLLVEGVVSSCKMAYEGKIKTRGSVISKPPVCTGILRKGGNGFSHHCSCPPPRLLARWKVQCSAAWSYFSSAWSPAVKRNGGILVAVSRNGWKDDWDVCDMRSLMLSDRVKAQDKLTMSRCFTSSKKNSNANRRKKISSTQLQIIVMMSILAWTTLKS